MDFGGAVEALARFAREGVVGLLVPTVLFFVQLLRAT